MPNIGFHFEKIPIPSLRAYSYFSCLSLLTALSYYCCFSKESFTLTFTNQPWCTAAVLNMCYCTWFLILASIKEHIFGPIRNQEIENIQDTFWNFVFHKCIFVFGVLNVQNMLKFICWMGWLGVLGSLHILTQLCIDRSDDISLRRRQSGETQVKILLLLLCILSCCGLLVYAAMSIGYFLGLNYMALLAAELIIVISKVLQTIIEQQIHVWNFNHPEQVWENKFVYLHYTEIVFSLLTLSIDFAHHIHMLLWVDMFLSMASLVLLMKLRFLYQEIYQKLEKHRSHWTITHNIQNLLDRVEPRREKCTICWDNINPGRILRCGHVFHTPCLYTWLRDHQTCPVCREDLFYLFGTSFQLENALSLLTRLTGTGRGAPHRRNLFIFAGSTLASWLPNFSVEVVDNEVLHSVHVLSTRDLHMMASQIHQVFPNISTYVILLDLSQTNSMSMTVDNIVQGNFYSPDLGDSANKGSFDNETRKKECREVLEQNVVTIDDGNETTERESIHPCQWADHTDERENMLERKRDWLIRLNKNRFLDKYPNEKL
ncbi:E3 ubiquitin-protein ligase AMFR-like [Oopsacas minuta]|uniref:E3 ubiquitin-protein ligase AMFR-like n=1 Tax=Oopsacas minuta TaxID=111878 RepID=A0AAV7K8G9_9METZ|nr:E3 ubiquitin-protein ligase AMFR-like [Oopsacas minuta]